MVRTTDNVMDIHPLERMEKLSQITQEKKSTIASKKKELEDLEKKKREEIDALEQKKKKEIDEIEQKKKKELDEIASKKKELEDLEKKKLKEIEDTENLIERSFQDLMKHKRMLIAEEEEKDKNRKLEVALEDQVMTYDKGKAGSVQVSANYSRFFDEMHGPHDVYKQVPKSVYEATNYNFYNSLTDLRNKAARGDITPEEERFLDVVRSQFERYSEDEHYARADDHQYIQRSLNVINQIAKYHKTNL